MTFAPSDIQYQQNPPPAVVPPVIPPVIPPVVPYYQLAAQQPYKRNDEPAPPWWAGKPASPLPSAPTLLQAPAPMWQGQNAQAAPAQPTTTNYTGLPGAPTLQQYGYVAPKTLPQAPSFFDYGLTANGYPQPQQQSTGLQQPATGQPYAANVTPLDVSSSSDVLRGITVRSGMSGQQSPYGNVPMSYSDVLRGYTATPPALPPAPTYTPTYYGGYQPYRRYGGGGYGGGYGGGSSHARRTVAALTRWNID
jgi:hypothetical protein